MGLDTSTSIGFKKSGNKRLTIETDSDATLVRAKGRSFVRIFPSSAGAAVTAVKGGAVKLASDIPEEVIEYVSFSGSSSSSLRYFPTGAVTISELSFFKAKPVAAYNAESNDITLDIEAHGICKVAYTAYFDRYVVSHGDAPCLAATTQSQGGATGATTEQANYDPAFLVATAEGWGMASQEISGPPCDQGESGLNDTQPFSDYEAVGIRVEEDVGVPVGFHAFYLSTSTHPQGINLRPRYMTINGIEWAMTCGCRFRVYPRGNVTILGVNCSVSTTPRSSGSKPVLQSLTFSGTQSANLDYPPSSEVTITQTGLNAISTFGESVEVDFRGPGEWVNEVVWKDRNTFDLAQGARDVRIDEVVVVTSLGSNTLPCYTFAQVQYTSDYDVYEMVFNYNSDTGWYEPAMILVTDNAGRIGTLQLNPPAQGGIL